MQTITLTTDFGTTDWFVGAMKGVILGINPRSVVVDITHGIPPGDIRAGALALAASHCYFPKNTVHVAVVDPGVGSERQAIAVRTANYYFVGPDNGVLSWALARERVKHVWLLENRKYFREPVSQTFHGRDVFAPVAAHLCRGLLPQKLGKEIRDFVRLPWTVPTNKNGKLQGEIVYIDHFGNAITNLERELFPETMDVDCEVTGRRKARCRLVSCYAEVPARRLVAVIGSSGLLEIAMNGSSAAKQYGLSIGDEVVVSTQG